MIDEEGEVVMTIPPEGEPVRCKSSFSTVETVEVTLDGETTTDFTVSEGSFGETTGLPDAHPGVINIVSRIVAEANPERDDLLMVHDTVRDDDGNIIGCKGFSRLPKQG